MLLGKITDMDLAAECDMAVRRFFFTHNHADKGRLPGPVRTDEGCRFTAAQEERQMVKELSVSKTAADLIEGQYLLAALFDRLKIKPKGRFIRLPFDSFQPIKLRLTASGLFGLDAGLVFADIFFRLVNMFLLLLISPFERFLLLIVLFDVTRIIPLVLGHLTVRKF